MTEDFNKGWKMMKKMLVLGLKALGKDHFFRFSGLFVR